MPTNRNDEKRLVEILFLEDLKLLKTEGLEKYYSKANTSLLEYLDPGKSYPYEKVNMKEGQLMFKIKYEDDPIFVVTLKKGGLNNNHYWVLDFYFPEEEKGFDIQKGLKGENYLDTVSKIFKEEILPYIESSEYPILYFKAYENDKKGNTRKKVFNKIIDKFVDKNKFNIEIKDNNFIIKYKNER